MVEALRAILGLPHMPNNYATLAESMKIEAAFRIENEAKLMGSGARLITAKSRIGSGDTSCGQSLGGG